MTQASTGQATTTVDDATREVTITRIFDAPRAMVFRAMVEPEQLVKFWGPTGTSVPLDSVVLEPWAGGRFETTMVADDGGGEYPTKAIFVEVTEPEVLSFREPDSGVLTEGRFRDLGDGRTELTIHQTNVPEMYRSPEALAGFLTSLDRFAEHLTALQR